MNQVNLPQWAIEQGRTRGGLDALDPVRTALIVVDLQNAFMVEGQQLVNRHARDIVPNVNNLAQATRQAGGDVVFLRHTISDAPRFRMNEWQLRMVPRTAEGDFLLRPGTWAHQLFDALEVRTEDLVVDKHRFSAFLPNSSDLDSVLKSRDIDTLIIAGTVTNVCCESTARDGQMLGYRILFVSDATAAFTDEEHNATLLSMATTFGDVRSTSSTIGLLRQAANA